MGNDPGPDHADDDRFRIPSAESLVEDIDLDPYLDRRHDPLAGPLDQPVAVDPTAPPLLVLRDLLNDARFPELFARALRSADPDFRELFPGGVGVVPWMVPGGADIALATCKKMEEFDAAVWAHHGLFASGPDFDITFGLMHTIEKAAEIWVLQKSTGLPELQTIQDDELRAIARDFKVQLREDFLD